MKRTYLDASVLIAAFRGEEAIAQRALALLDDPDRALLVSDYVRLEVLPKPRFLRRRVEVEFMEAVCGEASENVPASPEITRQALDIASRYDVAPLDALHASAALTAGADEMITVERATKPLFSVRGLTVVSLHSAD